MCRLLRSVDYFSRGTIISIDIGELACMRQRIFITVGSPNDDRHVKTSWIAHSKYIWNVSLRAFRRRQLYQPPSTSIARY